MRTYIGYIPKPEDIDLTDLDLSFDTLKSILNVDKKAWANEADEMTEHYKKFGSKLPEELNKQLDMLKNRLK